MINLLVVTGVKLANSNCDALSLGFLFVYPAD